MKSYWYLIVTIFLYTSQNSVYSQNLKLPYPIILVHGLTDSDQSWGCLINFMELNYGLTFGGRMDFCLNQDGDLDTSKLPEDYKDYTNCDLLHPFKKGDIYTINFDVSNYGIPYNNLIQSNQSGITKQGLAVGDAIRHVLNITGKSKVILVGHSMGGLAIREYLQRIENSTHKWWVDPSDNENGHHVAKVVTIGTPHLGSNFLNMNIPWLLYDLPDPKSEAVRDLRYRYNNTLTYAPSTDDNGVYLFGGSESQINIGDFNNNDFNCNSTENDNLIIGINSPIISGNFNVHQPLVHNISYTWIVSNYGILGDDGVVRSDRQYVYNIGDTINTNKPHISVGDDQGEASDYYSIIRGIDEPAAPALAYEIKKDSTIKGTITFQKDNFNLDIDLYKIIIDKSGYLTIKIEGNPLSGVGQIALLDDNQNALSFKPTHSFPTSLTYEILAGTYYIRVRGLATNISYKYAYTLSTLFQDIPNSTTKKITKLEYFIDIDPSFGNGLTLNVATPNDIDGTFNIPLNNIREGIHVLYIRAKDSENKWSITQNIPFYKQNTVSNNISKLEYFIDTDPGVGNGTKLSVSVTDNISTSVSIPLSSVSNGFHVLYVRAKDKNGSWSITSNSTFHKATVSSSDLVRMEYFIDTDPGFGNATAVTVTKGVDITKSISIDLNNVSKGFHTLYIRAKNVSGNWSLNTVNAFYCMQPKTTNITKLEYFFDMDPGFEYGTSIPITSASSDIAKQFNVDLGCLSTGNHIFYVRAKNDLGNWSLIYSKNISVTYASPIINQNGSVLSSNALIGNQWYNQNGIIAGATSQDYVITANGDYYVIVTHAGCSSAKSNTIKVLNTGFDKAEIVNSVKIYPNPTMDNFRISGLNCMTTLKLTDISGKEMLIKQILDNEVVSIGSLPKGMYIVKLITAYGVLERKILKK